MKIQNSRLWTVLGPFLLPYPRFLQPQAKHPSLQEILFWPPL